MKTVTDIGLGQALTPLDAAIRRCPDAGPGEAVIAVDVCGACRTDLHSPDGDLAEPSLPPVPAHETVGRVLATGPGVTRLTRGDRAHVPWLAFACGSCGEGCGNLCDRAVVTGDTRDGGYAMPRTSDGRVVMPLEGAVDVDNRAALEPLLCAGPTGCRSLSFGGDGRRLGPYGFDAAPRVVAQIAVHQGREVHALSRPEDSDAMAFARCLGAVRAGRSTATPSVAFDAAPRCAPAGAPVPKASRAVRKAGRILCGGTHLTDRRAFANADLCRERSPISVANLTRSESGGCLRAAKVAAGRIRTPRHPHEDANRPPDDPRARRPQRAAVPVP